MIDAPTQVLQAVGDVIGREFGHGSGGGGEKERGAWIDNGVYAIRLSDEKSEVLSFFYLTP